MSSHTHPHTVSEDCYCVACKPIEFQCPCDGCDGLRALAGIPDPKPPTQVAGVTGIAPERISMNETPANAIAWPFIAELPPFQMYATEVMRNTSGVDSSKHAQYFIRAKGAGQDLFDAYAAWHAAKGYWPNETPTGEAK